jgi:endonuclease/exonuclease/phosphatase family metal-dependent hydrolase
VLGVVVVQSVCPRSNVIPVDGNDDSRLLEVGHAAKLRPDTKPPRELKVVSYNIRWRGGDELRKLGELLHNDPGIGGASVIALQEVDRNKERTGHANTIRLLADQLGMYYAWAAPPATKSEKEEATGVAILSHYPLKDIHRIVLPHEGPAERRRVALGVTIVAPQRRLRVYSVHSETRIPIDSKLEQLKAALDDLKNYPPEMPAIVMGDFNTWEQEAVDRTTKLFKTEGFETPFDDQPTFFRRVLFVSIDLKLDWIWLRRFEATTHGVERKITLSDHWPLWTVVRAKG